MATNAGPGSSDDPRQLGWIWPNQDAGPRPRTTKTRETVRHQRMGVELRGFEPLTTHDCQSKRLGPNQSRRVISSHRIVAAARGLPAVVRLGLAGRPLVRPEALRNDWRAAPQKAAADAMCQPRLTAVGLGSVVESVMEATGERAGAQPPRRWSTTGTPPCRNDPSDHRGRFSIRRRTVAPARPCRQDRHRASINRHDQVIP